MKTQKIEIVRNFDVGSSEPNSVRVNIHSLTIKNLEKIISTLENVKNQLEKELLELAEKIKEEHKPQQRK